jgi:hypothetical protein
MGLVGALQEILTIVQRLADLEKRHDREVKELKDGISRFARTRETWIAG